jgi:uncharacterized membrane protein YraQ (UPF0718 family)
LPGAAHNNMAKPRNDAKSDAPLLDRSVVIFAFAASIAGAICFWLRGTAGVERAFETAGDILMAVAPQVAGGILIAGLVQVLIPREAVSRWLGEESGWQGFGIAVVAGACTPGGPFGSFALVYALGKVGADIGILICYLTSWTTLSLLRLLVWEIPFLGFNFAATRFVICLPMGIIAGLIARRLARQWGWRTENIVK